MLRWHESDVQVSQRRPWESDGGSRSSPGITAGLSFLGLMCALSEQGAELIQQPQTGGVLCGLMFTPSHVITQPEATCSGLEEGGHPSDSRVRALSLMVTVCISSSLTCPVPTPSLLLPQTPFLPSGVSHVQPSPRRGLGRVAGLPSLLPDLTTHCSWARLPCMLMARLLVATWSSGIRLWSPSGGHMMRPRDRRRRPLYTRSC